MSQTTLILLAVLIPSVMLHEISHGAVALAFGDDTAKRAGRLTLNPLKYSHPLLSIVLPLVFVILGGIGLPGGAVWVDHTYIRERWKDSLIYVTHKVPNEPTFSAAAIVAKI